MLTSVDDQMLAQLVWHLSAEAFGIGGERLLERQHNGLLRIQSEQAHRHEIGCCHLEPSGGEVALLFGYLYRVSASGNGELGASCSFHSIGGKARELFMSMACLLHQDYAGSRESFYLFRHHSAEFCVVCPHRIDDGGHAKRDALGDNLASGAGEVASTFGVLPRRIHDVVK